MIHSSTKCTRQPSVQSGVRQTQPMAFTLIELLASLAIMAILVALLVAAVRTARSKADASQCVSHLRQVYQFMVQDMQDYGVVPPAQNQMAYEQCGIPPGSTWINTQYNKRNQSAVFGCPAQRRAHNLPAKARTYSMNSTLANDYWNGPGNAAGNKIDGTPDARIAALFAKPSASVIFTDGAGFTNGSYNAGVNGYGPGSRPPEFIHGVPPTFVFSMVTSSCWRSRFRHNPNTDYKNKLGSHASIFWLGR